MHFIVKLIENEFLERKTSRKYHKLLTQVCHLEKEFTKDFSSEKWKEYNNLEIKKIELKEFEQEEIILFTYKICQKLFK